MQFPAHARHFFIPTAIILALVFMVAPAKTSAQTKPVLEKKVFIHYKNNPVKPAIPPSGNKTSTCYKFLAKGTAWTLLPQNYILDSSLDRTSVTAAFETWDAATNTNLFGSAVSGKAVADTDSPDYQNSLLFGSYPNNNVIAVTTTWGYFSGPVEARKIVDFDILFNTYYHWGDASSNPALMDLQNIATHEIGHGLGLSDLYESSCNAVTMYGYSTEGETSKRTLEQADITGLQKLYGI